MQEYQRKRERQEKASRWTGLGLTVFAHAVTVIVVTTSGFKYLDPPLPETSFVLDFIEMEDPVPEPERKGREPMAEEVDLTKPVELVRQSESPYEATPQNLTPSTTPDAFGDVEAPATPEEPKLDARASFPGMAKRDTSLTAPHSAENPSATFKEGQPDGNAAKAKEEGTATARVKGRNTIGTIPKPAYSGQNSGKVVVSIWVDQYGTVQKAIPGADGTTVTDKAIWNAVRNAAMNTKFNMSAEAPALQEGTITYIFKLK